MPEPNMGPVRRIVTVSDAEGYSNRTDDEQRDLQNRMADIQAQAARSAGIDQRESLVQGTGDGSLIAWPPGTNELDLLTNYIRELHYELERVNRTLNADSRIRLRLAISAGLVETAAQGVTGQAAIRASVLANSDPLRQALRNAADHPLAVIVDDKLFEDVVRTGRRGLQPGAYERVVIPGKGGEHVGWITVPATGRPLLPAASAVGPAAVGPATTGPAAAGEQPKGKTPRKGKLSKGVKAALITSGGVVLAAVITAADTFASSPSGSTASDPGSSSASAPATSPAPGSVSAPVSASRSVSPSGTTGRLYPEVTDNRLGTDVFKDPMGDAVSSGPPDIPYQTNVLVKCYALNESGMGSINDFYLVETAPWTGEYAPANTFLNADTTGTLDPKVPKC